MFLYTVLAALLGVAAGILLTVLTKKSAAVRYGVIDRIGFVCNIVLTAAYVCLAPFYMFIGMISTAYQGGFWGIVGWGISIICASAALLAGGGIGLSVLLRKKGKRVLSLMVQFIGVFAIAATFILYFSFVGTLIRPLN